MPLKTILFMSLFLFACAGAFNAPLWGVLGYVGHYCIGPERQWWHASVSSLGIRYSLTLAALTLLGMGMHWDKLRFGPSLLHRQEKLLLWFLADVGTTTFVSEADCDSFRQRHPHARVKCIPNGVDVDHFKPPAAGNKGKSAEPTLVFTGHMNNPNNERAATFLVRDVAPVVWRELPETRIQIVGADPTTTVRGLASERVEVTGRVEDMRPYLWNATVVALPMQSGTGIKNKLLEAWAAGASVVATPLACQGVPARDSQNLLIGNDADEVGRKVVELLRDAAARNQIAEAGLRTVTTRLTWKEATRRLREVASSPAIAKES